jgi:tetrahydromethanopterin S-methyltransferase subunit F
MSEVQPTRVLDRVHAKCTEERDLVTSANGVDVGVGAAGTTGLAAEVVLKNLLTLCRHVSAGVLSDVLPSVADDLAVDLELVEGVVTAHSDGQSQDGSSGLHIEGMEGVVGNVLVGVLSCIEKEQPSINEGVLERTNGM